MTFNVGKYTVSAANVEKTLWDVVSSDGKERFQLKDVRVGQVANMLLQRTASNLGFK